MSEREAAMRGLLLCGVVLCFVIGVNIGFGLFRPVIASAKNIDVSGADPSVSSIAPISPTVRLAGTIRAFDIPSRTITIDAAELFDSSHSALLRLYIAPDAKAFLSSGANSLSPTLDQSIVGKHVIVFVKRSSGILTTTLVRIIVGTEV